MIIDESVDMTDCDAGSIYLIKDEKLVFKAFCNLTFYDRWGEEKTKELMKTFEIPVTRQSIAGYAAITGKPVNIPDVNKIPKSADYKYDPGFDKKYQYKTVSMLVVPMLNMSGNVTGVLQLINSVKNGKISPFTQEHEKITMSFTSQAAIAIENAQLTEKLKNAHFDTIFRLSVAAEYRDKETSNHIKRVSAYAKLIAEKLGLSKQDIELLFWAAPMHDIGKLGIPDSILQKPGPLTPEERKEMQQHTVIGALVLKDSDVPVLQKSKIVALTHHEKIDGTGYPMGLRGDDIPIEGRIVALADVYDALVSKRCYKVAFDEEKIMTILRGEYNKQFDGEVLRAFISSIDEVRKIRENYSDKESDYDKLNNVKNVSMKDLLK
jgi:putative two-component system response regulator